MRAHGLTVGKDLDLRTIGVTKFGTSVRVPANEYFTDRGEGFSVVVVTVTPDPEPGSDQISHAYSDSWVGHHGYRRPDGTRQRARAFLGRTVSKDRKQIEEIFIVDIPDDITVPGPLGPLEGTKSTFPMPPAGTRQRRLTHTENSAFPGCQGIIRSSPDGDRILFRMKDAKNYSQSFLTTPYGETPKQVTFVDGGITDNARWNPTRSVIASVSANKILITNVEPGPRFGQTRVLIDKAPPPYALVWSHDGKTLAYNRAIKTNDDETRQIFVTTFEEQGE